MTRGKVRQFFGSIIGCVLAIISCLCLFSQLAEGPALYNGRSEPSVINAIAFFVAFGVPGISYALKAKFGLRSNEPVIKHEKFETTEPRELKS